MLHGVLFSSAFTTCNYFSQLIASLTSSKLLLSNKHAMFSIHCDIIIRAVTLEQQLKRLQISNAIQIDAIEQCLGPQFCICYL